MTRKTNPKSLENLKPRAPEKGTGSVKKSVTLHPATVAIASKLDEKSLSSGIDKLFAGLPVFYRVKRYLESQDDEVAAALLLELDALEIAQVYEECVAEGVIAVRGTDGSTAAWIV